MHCRGALCDAKDRGDADDIFRATEDVVSASRTRAVVDALEAAAARKVLATLDLPARGGARGACVAESACVSSDLGVGNWLPAWPFPSLFDARGDSESSDDDEGGGDG